MLLVAALWGAGVPAAAPLASQRLANGHRIPPHIVTILDRACLDCHSNQTRWPWYSNVAPVSWLVQADVDEGRRVLNFSEWTRGYEEALVTWGLAQHSREVEPSPEGKRLEEVLVAAEDVIAESDPYPNFLNLAHVRTREQVIRRESLLELGAQ